MKFYSLAFGLFCILATACNSTTTKDVSNTPQIAAGNVEMFGDFKKTAVNDISDDLFMINNKWMMVTAGTTDSFNSMTASWGGFGTIWEKPVTFMTIRDTRYTYEFLNREPVYTLTFFDEKYRKTMQMIGSRSGRDTNKIKDSGLTPVTLPSGAMSYKEASLIIECRKLLVQPIDTAALLDKDLINEWYQKEPVKHNLFFGEITNVWKK